MDISEIRANTPGITGNGVHLDNAGSSLMSGDVVAAMKNWMDREAAIGGYRAAEEGADQLAAVYSSLAALFGAEARQYGLSSGGADAFARLFFSVPLDRGDNIVTSFNEYCSNYLAYLHQSKRKGFEIRIAPAGPDGQIDLDALEGLIDSRTRLVSLSHNTATSGLVLPAAEIGEICRRHGVLYLLDATQTVGHMPVNFEETGCHMATGTGRKWLRGPRGVGFFYLSEEAIERIDPAMVYNQSGTWLGAGEYELRQDAFLLEGWERSCVNQAGFGAALQELADMGVEAVSQLLFEKAAYLREGIGAISGASLTDPEAARSAIVTCNIDGAPAQAAKARLAEKGYHVNVAVKEHTLLDFDNRNLEAVIRISPHYYTSFEELDGFLEALQEIAT